jgi:predicted  nucleic acid-binding Zn-ribbon protein
MALALNAEIVRLNEQLNTRNEELATLANSHHRLVSENERLGAQVRHCKALAEHYRESVGIFEARETNIAALVAQWSTEDDRDEYAFRALIAIQELLD